MNFKNASLVAAAFVTGSATMVWFDRRTDAVEVPLQPSIVHAKPALNRALLTALQTAQHDHPNDDALRSALAQLEKRISALETSQADDPENETVAPHKPNDLSDSAFGTIIDDAIRHNGSDRTLREHVKSELTQSLKQQAPDLDLDDVDCSKRFCRATFTQADGFAPSISTLLGSPPLTGDGFSLSGADGRTTVYFAPAGESLSVAREEALAIRGP